MHDDALVSCTLKSGHAPCGASIDYSLFMYSEAVLIDIFNSEFGLVSQVMIQKRLMDFNHICFLQNHTCFELLLCYMFVSLFRVVSFSFENRLPHTPGNTNNRHDIMCSY